MPIAPDAPAIVRFAADLARLSGEGPVLLAVSGGPDSMAMLALAIGMRAGVTVATVDHGLRADAAAEAAMVAAICADHGLAHATLRPAGSIEGASLQARARQARYALLADHARSVGAAAIATAHHVDDQAETLLMRAGRGAGLSGMAGIRSRVVIEGVPVIRPLLDWRRAELRGVVRRAGLRFVDDPANADPRHDRTRYRRLLEENEWLDPLRLAHTAGALAEADSDVRTMTDWLWRERATPGDTEVTLAVDDLPREWRRRLVRRAVAAVRIAAGIDAPEWPESADVESVLAMLSEGRQTTRGGVLASARGPNWRFRPAPARRTG
ncbi:tRNA lysidine(34) synthetase TilS [Sphingomonas bacterium]|uniref:tRNA lysidine(34) synthetase TilS n=1 Tax=Sphingomonas bacterium TaxID=1895847 RepID=UPI0020C61377|nr:tRNA lysidine(34) synthetase TilS [Sphingomonas bacterium]